MMVFGRLPDDWPKRLTQSSFNLNGNALAASWSGNGGAACTGPRTLSMSFGYDEIRLSRASWRWIKYEIASFADLEGSGRGNAPSSRDGKVF